MSSRDLSLVGLLARGARFPALVAFVGLLAASALQADDAIFFVATWAVFAGIFVSAITTRATAARLRELGVEAVAMLRSRTGALVASLLMVLDTGLMILLSGVGPAFLGLFSLCALLLSWQSSEPKQGSLEAKVMTGFLLLNVFLVGALVACGPHILLLILGYGAA